jgi:hypothetical protein
MLGLGLRSLGGEFFVCVCVRVFVKRYIASEQWISRRFFRVLLEFFFSFRMLLVYKRSNLKCKDS